MKSLSDTDCSTCIIYQVQLIQVNSDNLVIRYLGSDSAGRTVFKKKLRVYKSDCGFYVIIRSKRYYVADLMHKWFYK